MLNTHSIDLSLATTEECFELKHFLKRHKQSQIQRHESVYIVRLNRAQTSTIIGVAKLIHIFSSNDSPSTYWLRGLYIESSQRKKGYANQLLRFMAESINHQTKPAQIIAFPLKHLEALYRKQGYQIMESTELPSPLRHQYQPQKGWLCMHYTEACTDA